MRIIVFFDLPVTSSAQRKAATQFRNFLLKDGYQMLQFSVYSRICNGVDAVDKHRSRLLRALPKEGAIRMLTITEKQYANMEILLGTQAAADDNISIDDLMLSIF